MPNISAEFWSAVAASFAAIASFLIFLNQRRNLLESVRPELVLTGWTRGGRYPARDKDGPEIITFETIKNVGRGSALHVIINCGHIVDNKPTAVLSTTRLSILAPNEDKQMNGEISVHWKNVPSKTHGHKSLPITIEILCWDSRSMRHQTFYKLYAVELTPSVAISDPIARGLALTSRTTIVRPVWQLKLLRRVKRIPGVGKLFSNREIE